MSKIEKLHRAAVWIIICAYAAASAAGLASFIIFKSASVTAPVGTAPPETLGKEINLARFENRSWIEASSYAWLYIHHPLFVIDGLRNPPSRKEEWVPDRRTDGSPSLTVHLARRADLSRVVVAHEGRYTERYYTLSCLRDGKVLESMEPVQTEKRIVEYPLECTQADAVRLEFYWDPYDPEGHIRIQEIEVWGR